MSYKQSSHKLQKVLIQPINVIFRHLQNRTRVSIWLYEQPHLKIEGVVIGFDEYMNMTLDNAEEVREKRGFPSLRREIGRILVRGDNITLIQPVLDNV